MGKINFNFNHKVKIESLYRIIRNFQDMNILQQLNLDVYQILDFIHSIHKRYDVFEGVQSKFFVFTITAIFSLVKLYQSRYFQIFNSGINHYQTNSFARRQILQLGKIVVSKIIDVFNSPMFFFYNLFLKSFLQDLKLVIKKFVQILIDLNFISIDESDNQTRDSFRHKTNFLIKRLKDLNAKKSNETMIELSGVKAERAVTVKSSIKLSVKVDRPENNFIKQNIQKIQNSSSSADLKRTRATPTYVKTYAGMSTNILNKVKKKLDIDKGNQEPI